MKLKAHAHAARAWRSSQKGFSLVELVISLAVLLIITTIAVPVVVRSLQIYQLNSAASQLSGLLKFTKFEAIRQNLPVSCQIVQQPDTTWLVWVDSNGNGQADGAEPQMIIGGSFSLLPGSSVPDTGSITSTLGGNSGVPLTVLSASPASEEYDHRGVLVFPGTPTIYALFLGNPNDSSSGYRAIITLPSGAVQVWSAPAGGPWLRVS